MSDAATTTQTTTEAPQAAVEQSPATQAPTPATEAAAPAAAEPPPPTPAEDLAAKVRGYIEQRKAHRARSEESRALKAAQARIKELEGKLADTGKPVDPRALVRGLPADEQIGVLRELSTTEADRAAEEEEMAKQPARIRKLVAEHPELAKELAATKAELAELKTWRDGLDKNVTEAKAKMEEQARRAHAESVFGAVMGDLQADDLGLLGKLEDKDDRLRSAWNAALEELGDAAEGATPEELRQYGFGRLVAQRARQAAEAESKRWLPLLVPTSGTPAQGATTTQQATSAGNSTRERIAELSAAQAGTATVAVPVQGGQPGPAVTDPAFLGMTTSERAAYLRARREGTIS